MARERVLIAANPKSGAGPSGAKVAELNQALCERGFQSEVITSLEEVQRQSQIALESGDLKAVVSAGGDGTADALANLISTEAPMLVFPLGTENLLAKHLGLTNDTRAACDAIASGQRFRMDVGSANGQLFLVMLSIGFDAEVVREMTAVRTGHINRWSYTRPILNSLRKYRFPQIQYEITAPNATAQNATAPEKLQSSAAWIFVFNVPRYAASLDFCPQADPTDGLLDVCTFDKSGVTWGMGYLSRLLLGKHQSMRGFQHTRASKMSVSAAKMPNGALVGDIPFQIDGDPGGILPLNIDVLPGKLTLIVSPDQ